MGQPLIPGRSSGLSLLKVSGLSIDSYQIQADGNYSSNLLGLNLKADLDGPEKIQSVKTGKTGRRGE